MLTTQVEILHRENEALWVDTTQLPEDTETNHNKQDESRAIGETDADDGDKNKMQHELCNPMEKYEVMAKKGASSSVDQMLTSINLSYSVEVMAIPLS